MAVEFTTNREFALPDNDEVARSLVNDEADYWFKHNNDILRDFLGNFDIQTYTPRIFNSSAASTELTVGSGGTVDGRYRVLPGKVIIGWVRFFLGTSPFSEGTGILYIQLPESILTPFHVASTAHGAGDAIGSAVMRDNSTASTSQNGVIQLASTVNRLISISTERSTFARWVQVNAPFTFEANDVISCNFMYRGS